MLGLKIFDTTFVCFLNILIKRYKTIGKDKQFQENSGTNDDPVNEVLLPRKWLGK